ncbi:hypothetical protein PR202_ga24756 [Eleusine coracana subsp. coracana]|uniref:FAF domain-containing protein n=1 Tax=Eleusine coracana subsp. coracana TaxID=191504 RepID=A0AAV5DA69_ELECO|nr:hypothetical protein PR202_ga24756 [Eleusine coracana subsp. coracana]
MAAAADGGLRRLFEKPMPENPTLLEALSAWNHHRVHPNNKPIDPASFTEIFGELHFQEKPEQQQQQQRAAVLPRPPPRATPSSSWADEADKSKDDSSLDALLRPKPAASGGVKRSASFCMKKSSASSLLLCTEGLGSESTVDADDMLKDDGGAEAAEAAAITSKDDKEAEEQAAAAKAAGEKKPPPSFPPPIRSIGRVGKPSICFRSFRADGRFVLMEVVIPGKELLQAYREGGRLRLQFADGAAAAGNATGKEMMMQGEEHQDEAKKLCMDEDKCQVSN